MPKKIDPRLIEILTQYGESAEDALWDCHGTWVAYHKAIERIAAKAGVKYDAPQVLVAERDAAAILVFGTLDSKSEWSIGEAAINLNYRVSVKQAAYPFAMAEKRAKDRVVLKLIGLHGLVYSEEESDDFKREVEPSSSQPRTSSASLKRSNVWSEMTKEIGECKSPVRLQSVREAWSKKAATDKWPSAWCDAAAEEFEKAEKELRTMAARDASEANGHDLRNHPLDAA
ncbi:MAG: trna delta -isopentenylpyrophosphate transferase [Hyphomicrobiales bacterium]|nr:trna delta -isopentenylpyrophosphate transferase [Hyphomicrobiales bacterium]